MSLRLIEFFLPKSELSRVSRVLADHNVVDTASIELPGERGLVRVLLDAGKTETVTDALSRAFQAVDGFRLVLLPVEATLPRPSDDESESAPDAVRSRIPDRVSREELYQDVAAGARTSGVFFLTVILSTLVAAVGLIRGDVAIIIGAMVIAPLLGPNVALSLASTLGDVPLALRAVKTNAVGLVTSLLLSIGLGMALGVDPGTPEIASRTRVELSDVVLALASGSAGALAFTSALPSAFVGVMVSVALLPPLVVGGLLLGAGWGSLSLGAFLLVLTNVTCVNLSGVATFLAQRIRPRTWWDAERARRATRFAIASWMFMLAVLVLSMLLLEWRLPTP